MLKKKYQTGFLYPKTTFVIGMGAILNVAGNYFRFNYSEAEEDADARAIEADWGVIGQDIEDTVKNNPVKKAILEVNPT